MASPSFGTWPAAAAAGAGGLTPIGVVRLALGAGTEQIDGQIGNVVTSINVNGVGDYELVMNADAGDVNSLFWTIGAGDFVAREVVLFPTLPTMALNVYDAAGAHAAIGRVCITFWKPAT